jgi:hypothetical protein
MIGGCCLSEIDDANDQFHCSNARTSVGEKLNETECLRSRVVGASPRMMSRDIETRISDLATS